jgi:hypothetical protein
MKTTHHAFLKIGRGASLILGALLSLNCAPGKAPGSGTDRGEVNIALTLPGGQTISSVSWKVMSSSNAVVDMGTLDTSGTTSIGFISSLPAGTGDTLQMTAMTSAGVACTGTSSSFNVTSGGSTPVSVNLQCGALAADGGTLGSVVVSGSVVAGDNCPSLSAWFITPQQTMGSAPIDVSVTGTDPDVGETVTYAWTATSGSFASATSAMTQYTCGATGMQTLSVAITDNHMPTPCTTHVSFPAVDCQ